MRSILLSLMLLAGCRPDLPGGPADFSSRPVRAVATTGMVGDLVREIGGQHVEVQALMGPGVDPHLYQASEGDVTRLGEADVIFYNGLHLEGRMDEILERMNDLGRTTVAVTEGIPRERLITSSGFSGNYDPHVWFDVQLWREAISSVEHALASLDTLHADAYAANAERYRTRLDSLDRYVRERIETIPPARRVLVTAHDAFGYFGRAYGVEVIGLQGLSTATEAGAGDVQRLAATIAERRIPALFVESSVSPRSIEAVQAAVRARGFEVRIGGSLYSDALGGPGTGAETYEGMVRSNVEAMVAALGDGRGIASHNGLRTTHN